jgi:hypothetical protein
MLAVERKRGLRTLAIGLVLAVTVEGTLHALDWRASTRLSSAVSQCKDEPSVGEGSGHGKWGPPICEPKELTGLPDPWGITKEILDADADVQRYEGVE